MRRSLLTILIASAAINLLLLAVLFSLRRPAAAAAAAEPADSNNPVVRTKYSIIARKQAFNWSEVESPDYRLYIGHLREIGCPEQTIRDIVMADVNQLYDRKRLDEIPTMDQEWWRSEPDTNLLVAATAKSQALDRERRALLDGLLGPNWSVEDAERQPIALSGQVLGDLSEETKQAVRDIVARGQKRMELSSTNSNPGANEVASAKVESQVRAELGKVLTPAQLEEFLLRYSSTAADLRNQLQGFDVTPEQFRRMFELRDPIVRQLQLAGASDLSDASRAALQKQLDDSIKDVLGTDQYHAFQISQDPAYRDAAALAADHNAASNVVDKLYQINALTRQELDRISKDPNLTPEQKEAQMAAAQQQAKTYSDELLGVAPPPPEPPMPPPPPPVAIHPYVMGETIDLIAQRYGVSPGAIIAANPDLNLTALARGTPIRVPLPQQAPAAPSR